MWILDDGSAMKLRRGRDGWNGSSLDTARGPAGGRLPAACRTYRLGRVSGKNRTDAGAEPWLPMVDDKKSVTISQKGRWGNTGF